MNYKKTNNALSNLKNRMSGPSQAFGSKKKQEQFVFGGPTPKEQLRATQLKAGGGVVGANEAKQEALKDYDTNFKKHLEGPGVGKAAYRAYNKVKEVQQKLPYVARTLSEVVTSPFDVGVKLAEVKDEKRNLLLNKNQKRQQLYDLGSSVADFVGLATLGGTTVVRQGVKTAFNLSKKPAKKLLAKVLPGFAAKEILAQKAEDEIGSKLSLK